MENLFRTFKQVFRIYKQDILSYILFPAVGAIIGIVIVYVIMAADGSGEDYGKLGTMFALLLGAIIIFFGEIFYFQQEFNMAISMGKTRKDFIPAKYILSFIKCALCLAVILFINRLEDFIYTAVYPNAVCELGFDMFLGNVGLCILFIVVLPVIILVLGGLYMKFANKVFWILYGIWMLACLFLPRMHDAIEKNPASLQAKIGLALINFISNISVMEATITFAICFVAGIIAVYFLFRKQRVTA